MTTSALWLLALLAAPAGAAARAPPSTPAHFAGCRALPLADHGWKYACGVRSARTEDHRQGPTSSYVDGYEAGVAATFGPGLVRSSERRRLGGGREDVTLRVGTAADGPGGYAIALLRRAEGLRLVACVTEDRRRAPCDAAPMRHPLRARRRARAVTAR